MRSYRIRVDGWKKRRVSLSHCSNMTSLCLTRSRRDRLQQVKNKYNNNNGFDAIITFESHLHPAILGYKMSPRKDQITLLISSTASESDIQTSLMRAFGVPIAAIHCDSILLTESKTWKFWWLGKGKGFRRRTTFSSKHRMDPL